MACKPCIQYEYIAGASFEVQFEGGRPSLPLSLPFPPILPPLSLPALRSRPLPFTPSFPSSPSSPLHSSCPFPSLPLPLEVAPPPYCG